MTTPKRKPGRPPTGHDPDPVRGVRVSDARWKQFHDTTKTLGTDKSKAINALLAWYIREPNANLPKRLKPPSTENTA